MDRLNEIVAKIVGKLPPEIVRTASDKIKGRTDWSGYEAAASTVWGSAFSKDELHTRLVAVAKENGLAPQDLTLPLRTAASTYESLSERSHVDVLWTGPMTRTVPVRKNEQALCELIASARKRLFIVSFVAYKATLVYDAIRSAIDRGVQVSFLTESDEAHGGSLDTDPVASLREQFPEATFFRWKTHDGTKAVVHAKCAVADEGMAMVTSANLTGAAMTSNMEIGVLLKGERVARQLADHLNALVIEKIIEKA